MALEELLTHTFTFLPTPLVGATRVDRLERYLNTLVESCHPAGLPSSLCRREAAYADEKPASEGPTEGPAARRNYHRTPPAALKLSVSSPRARRSFLKNSIPPHIDHCHACTHNQSERTSAAFAFSRRLSAETTLSTLSDS